MQIPLAACSSSKAYDIAARPQRDAPGHGQSVRVQAAVDRALHGLVNLAGKYSIDSGISARFAAPSMAQALLDSGCRWAMIKRSKRDENRWKAVSGEDEKTG